MVLSHRERMIALVTLGAVALLAVNSLVLTPLAERRDRVDAEAESARLELERANRLFSNGRRVNERWQEMLGAGLTSDASDAEARALAALSTWAREAGLGPPTSLRPERREVGEQFQTITLRATGTGSMENISDFLRRIQSADLPLRVTDMQLTTRTEGSDELSLQLGVSTICLAPEPERNARPGQGRPATAAQREVLR